MVAVADDTHLYALNFCEIKDKEFFLKKISKKLDCSLEVGDEGFLELKEWLSSYFYLKAVSYLPYQLVGTPFQTAVWEAVAAIPFGETRSYQEIAAAIGKPKASRAVGQAIGRNPILLMIPCHRVICSDGGMGGFSSGIERKRWLLQHEIR